MLYLSGNNKDMKNKFDAYAFLEKKGYQIDNTEEVEINGVKYEKLWYTDDNGLYQWVLHCECDYNR